MGLSPVVEDMARKGSTSSTSSPVNISNYRYCIATGSTRSAKSTYTSPNPHVQSLITPTCRDSDSAAFLTPAIKKKRKLYSTMPQHSEVGNWSCIRG